MKYFLVWMLLFLAASCENTQKKTKKDTAFTESINRGAIIYEDFCINCHLPNGKGVEDTFPPLAKSDYLMKNITASIKAIKYGQQGEIVVNGETYDNVMAPLGLSDQEIADVMNYITNSWGNDNGQMINISEVSAITE